MTPLSAKSYVNVLLIPFGIAAVLFWALALYFQPVNGDLTRIGRWSENDFGWNAPQPIINVLGNGKPIARPDIVVLGDSFSIANYWQSALSSGLNQKAKTFNYEDAGCVDNWIRWAKETPSAGTVIIQVVERNFVSSFKDIGKCKASTPKPQEVAAGATAPRRATWPPTLDAKYLFISAYNTLAMHARVQSTIRRSQVINAPLKANCAKFSNLQSRRLLYLRQDERKLGWNAADVERAVVNVVRLQGEVTRAGKRFIFMVAPDKSSVYRECLLNPDAASHIDVTRQLTQAGVNAPDVMAALRANINTVTDLYHPNNTHWSESGYLLVAGLLEKFARQ